MILKEERVYLSLPCLIKLESYTGGSYTDGVNTYIFQDDGTVLPASPTREILATLGEYLVARVDAARAY